MIIQLFNYAKFGFWGCWRLMEVGNSTFSDFDEISFNWNIFHPTLWFHTVFYHFLVFTPLPLLYIRPTKKTDTSPKLDFGVKCAGLLSAYNKVWYLYHTVVLFFIHLELPHFVVPYSGLFWNILECYRKWIRGYIVPHWGTFSDTKFCTPLVGYIWIAWIWYC